MSSTSKQIQKVFVTVGTTKFDKLIDTILSEETLIALKSLGCKSVHLQVGNSYQHIRDKRQSELDIRFSSYVDNFEEEIEKADLVISHGGAGTCLDVLHKGKALIVVINEDLMDNHQIELAEKLQSLGYSYCCTCSTLNKVLKKDLTRLQKYPLPEKAVFSSYLDSCVGFA